jgi:hypothetical protein
MGPANGKLISRRTKEAIKQLLTPFPTPPKLSFTNTNSLSTLSIFPIDTTFFTFAAYCFQTAALVIGITISVASFLLI